MRWRFWAWTGLLRNLAGQQLLTSHPVPMPSWCTTHSKSSHKPQATSAMPCLSSTLEEMLKCPGVWMMCNVRRKLRCAAVHWSSEMFSVSSYPLHINPMAGKSSSFKSIRLPKQTQLTWEEEELYWKFQRAQPRQHMPGIPARRMVRQDDRKSEASLIYIAGTQSSLRPCPRKTEGKEA